MLAVNDISTVGRCALSVIMPTMSALGVCVYPLPTAVLSTHTGGFGVPAKTDLTTQLESSMRHYAELDISPSCIYTGYLTSPRQAELCKNILTKSKDTALRVVDPVMADNGKLYSGFDDAMVSSIRELVASADVILPNPTEAALLLKEPYRESYTGAEIKNMLQKLGYMTGKIVVVTGVIVDGEHKNVCYNTAENSFLAVRYNRVPASYPGTGDIFASVFISELLRKNTERFALELATAFAELCVRTTYKHGTPHREGVLLEPCLGELSSLAHSFSSNGGYALSEF